MQAVSRGATANRRRENAGVRLAIFPSRTPDVSVSDVEWAAFSGSLGAAENGFESRISNTSPSGDATVGNSVGVLVNTAQGLGCGGLDGQLNGNC